MRKIFCLGIMLMMCLGLFSQVPTKERFTEVCDSLRIHHPNVVYAQARLESGNFKHPYYKRTKNCLGIYDSKKSCYKTFNNWIECLKSYRDEVQYKYDEAKRKYDEAESKHKKHPYKKIGDTDDDYLDWIISIGYASDTLYRQKVKQILKEKK